MPRHVKTTIRYDGPALAGHEMDVQDLAPALLALAEIVQIANRKFNDERANIRVLVNADVEQKCFMLDVSLVQSLMDQAATFLGQKDVATAKEIGEWIGLIGGPAIGLFGLYRRLYGTPKAAGGAGTTFQTTASGNTTIINVNGDGNIIQVPSQTAELARDPEVMKQVKAVLAPLQRDGYEDFSIVENDETVARINREEALNIRAAVPYEEPVIDEDTVRTLIPGRVGIRTARLEGAAQWELKWAGKPVWAKIDDREWMDAYHRGAIALPPGTWMDVTMEMATSRSNPDSAPTYKVVKVHGTHTPQPATQTSFLSGE